MECTAPVHPAVISLLEAYCSSCVLPLIKSVQHHASVANAPLEEKEILVNILDSLLTPKVVTFYVSAGSFQRKCI